MHSHSLVVTATALDSSGRRMIDVVPELKLLVGEQLPVVEASVAAGTRLSPADVPARVLGILARPEHSLALFLDESQWLDAATLDKAADMKVSFYAATL